MGISRFSAVSIRCCWLLAVIGGVFGAEFIPRHNLPVDRALPSGFHPVSSGLSSLSDRVPAADIAVGGGAERPHIDAAPADPFKSDRLIGKASAPVDAPPNGRPLAGDLNNVPVVVAQPPPPPAPAPPPATLNPLLIAMALGTVAPTTPTTPNPANLPSWMINPLSGNLPWIG